MNKINPTNIGINLKRLRKATDLSQDELATLIPISERSIANIEKGDPNVGVSILNILLDFFDLDSLEELSDSNLKIDNDLRQKLAIHHQQTHPEYLKSLTKIPRIVYAIDFFLLPSNKLKKPMKVKDIREFFSQNFGWDFESSSVSNALFRKSKQIRTIKEEGLKDKHYLQKEE